MNREDVVADPSPGLRAAWRILAEEGGSEERLVAAMESAGEGERLAELFFLLETLERRGLLCRNVCDGDRLLATLEPQAAVFRFYTRALPPAATFSLSRFACLRRDGDGLIIESPLAHARIRFHDPGAASLTAFLSAPVTLATLVRELAGHLSEDAVTGIVSLLAAAGMLADKEEENVPLSQWEFHDLLFHASSRRGRHDRPSGGTHRFAGLIEPLPAVKEARGETLSLPEPSPLPPVPFSAVLHRRRSVREQGAEPLTLGQLGDLLWHAGRLREVAPADPDHGRLYDVVRRPYPTGGGCSELEIYPAVNACDGLPRGLYRYDGSGHNLEVTAPPTPAFEHLLHDAAAACGTMPQVLLVIAARFQRVSWKYESIAYSLILKDVGCLQQTLYLVATALGLAPCALGVGDADLFAGAAGTGYYVEGAVGEFVVGAATPGIR